jgi:MFS family permease
MTSLWIDNPVDEPSPTFGPIPWLSVSPDSPHRTDEAAVRAYYADRRLMLRNIILIGIATIGWNVALQVVTPLMAVRLLDLGVQENVQGTINSINLWAVSFLVMFFGWMSDHTISRHGRRKPYLFIAAPFIVAVVTLFPFFAFPRYVPLLLMLQGIYLLFMDLKNSTFALVMIDCVPSAVLARAMAVVAIVTGLVSFLANRYAADLLQMGEKLPFIGGAAVMCITTLAAGLVREPPIYHPRTGPFRPWSTFRVAAAFDKKIFILMAGIALLFAYPSACTQWLWFWSKESLGLSRADIFRAVSWAALANVALSYPIGWAVDRWGGLRVVLAFQVLCIACFIGTLYVHSKFGLTMLVVAQTVTFPLYWSADLIVFKSCPPQNIGAITSTNSCIRNAFLGFLSLATGWAIYWCHHNYIVSFAIGLALTSAGCVLCCIYTSVSRGQPVPAVTEEIHVGIAS